MRVVKIITLVVLSFICLEVSADNPVKATFKVWGNCGMCQTKIEKAANAVKGVKSAKWNMSTHQMTVKFDSSVTSIDAIQKAIAAVGYDTVKYKADDAVYKKLHGCCQYNRD